MLTKRYLSSTKNLADILNQIIKGTAPTTFNLEHLQGLGFASSNDRAIIPLLKELGFLSESGVPTARYHAYRAGDKQAKKVLGEALLEAYGDLFTVNARPTEADKDAIRGKFKTTHNVADRVAECMTMTFFALLKLADLEAARSSTGATVPPIITATLSDGGGSNKDDDKGSKTISLRYNIEVHLPPTKDVEVYNAIFKALKEHLL